MADVFLSYSRADHDTASRLVNVIERSGLSTFSDRDLMPGMNFAEEMSRQVERAKLVVVLWTQNALGSKWVQNEVKLAIKAWSQGRLLLVRVDGAELPTGLGGLQALEVSTTGGDLPRDAYETIGRAVRDQLNEGMPMPVARAPESPRAALAPYAGNLEYSTVGARSRSSTILFFFVVLGLGLLLAGALIYFLKGSEDRLSGVSWLGEIASWFLLVLVGVMVLYGIVRIIGWAVSRRPARTFSSARTPIPQPAPAPAEANPDVFISYSRQDRSTVDPLVESLRASGLNVWIDTQQQNADNRYAGRIVRAIRSCRSVLLMCSKTAFASDHVVRELYVAGDFKKPFIALELDGSELPDEFQYFLTGYPRLPIVAVDRREFGSTVLNLMPA